VLRHAACPPARWEWVAAGHPKPGPPLPLPLIVTVLKGDAVDRRRASVFSPVVGAEVKLQRRPGSTLCALAVAEVLVPRLPKRRTPPPPGGRFPDEPPFPAAPAFELSQPALHRTTRRAKSQPPRLRRQPPAEPRRHPVLWPPESVASLCSLVGASVPDSLRRPQPELVAFELSPRQ
jgi:hypothetical protein